MTFPWPFYFSHDLSLAVTFYKFLKLLCFRVFLTLNSSTDTNFCVHLNVCPSRCSIWLFKDNTITGKPEVFIVTHKVKNPNWKEVKQLAIYKRDRGFELEAFVCDKRDRAITCVFCRDLHLTFMCSGLLQKGLWKGRWSLAEIFWNIVVPTFVTQSFAVFSPLPSCCLC